MSEESTTVEVADEIKAVMEDENFIPSSEDIECYGKHQIKPSEILPCPFCGSEHLYFGDWGTHGAYDKVSCGNECIDWVPVERWNSRPVEEALQKRIAELEELNELRKISLRLKADLLECEVAMCGRLRKALGRVVKLLDRPMLKDDMCLYMDKAIRVAREAWKGAENE